MQEPNLLALWSAPACRRCLLSGSPRRARLEKTATDPAAPQGQRDSALPWVRPYRTGWSNGCRCCARKWLVRRKALLSQPLFKHLALAPGSDALDRRPADLAALVPLSPTAWPAQNFFEAHISSLPETCAEPSFMEHYLALLRQLRRKTTLQQLWCGCSKNR